MSVWRSQAFISRKRKLGDILLFCGIKLKPKELQCKRSKSPLKITRINLWISLHEIGAQENKNRLSFLGRFMKRIGWFRA